jgi:cell wall-associated NlpC family hydrolase
MNRALRLTPLVILIGIAASVLAPQPAVASPIDDKQAEAAQLSQQINDNGRRMDALNEQINSAQLALDDATAKIATADAQVAAATSKTKQLRSELARRAATLYRQSGETGGVANLDAQDANELNTRRQYTSLAAQREKQLVTELAVAKEDLAARKADAEQARGTAQAKKSEIQSAKDDLATGDAKQRSLLSQVKGEIAQLVAQQEQERAEREAAAARARVPAAPVVTSASVGTSTSTTQAPAPAPRPAPAPARAQAPAPAPVVNAPAPAPSGGAATAIAYAYAQLGKPYCYAGVGPGCFDCSGLTMMAWGQAGVGMPHGSTEQYNMFPHVPLSQAQPGDLIVWDGHVGLYIGGGMMIHAPHTGTVVQIAPLYGTPWGAARPG